MGHFIREIVEFPYRFSLHFEQKRLFEIHRVFVLYFQCFIVIPNYSRTTLHYHNIRVNLLRKLFVLVAGLVVSIQKLQWVEYSSHITTVSLHVTHVKLIQVRFQLTLIPFPRLGGSQYSFAVLLQKRRELKLRRKCEYGGFVFAVIKIQLTVESVGDDESIPIHEHGVVQVFHCFPWPEKVPELNALIAPIIVASMVVFFFVMLRPYWKCQHELERRIMSHGLPEALHHLLGGGGIHYTDERF
mmetsp:Transcript_3835/g.8459  ORF Transcript_3835/g.8459 Transcript_3835/m.8459 type:complete len:243 (-) Transcript_3835:385-1113(-)